MVTASFQATTIARGNQGPDLIERSVRRFAAHYGYEPQATGYAPGRVTVIGSHTDYNGGLVVSAPLSNGTAVSLMRTGSRRIRVVSDQQPRHLELAPGRLVAEGDAFWSRYIIGALRELGCEDDGYDISVCSNLPMGRGLASSAALVVGTVRAILQEDPSQPASWKLVRLCQRVEQVYAGVMCGILDPYTALHAQHSRDLLLIDCRDGSHLRMPLPEDLAIVVCDSGATRELAQSQYNLRRAQCGEVAAVLGHPSLRSVSPESLSPLWRTMPEASRRAEHVIREIARVPRFWRALADHDYESVKSIMADAHRSGRELFDCSHPDVDELVQLATRSPGCIGARFTGAGWGGATVNLVMRDTIQAFCDAISSSWRGPVTGGFAALIG